MKSLFTIFPIFFLILAITAPLRAQEPVVPVESAPFPKRVEDPASKLPIPGKVKAANVSGVEKIRETLATFKDNRNPQLLRIPLSVLLSAYIPRKDPQETRRALLEVTDLWFLWFEGFDSIRDKSVPMNDGSMNIMVPTEAGRAYPSGVSPEAVEDPILREKYVAALLENKRIIEASNRQIVLLQFEERAEVGIQLFLHKTATSFPELKQQMKELLDKSALTDARKLEFNTAIVEQ